MILQNLYLKFYSGIHLSVKFMLVYSSYSVLIKYYGLIISSKVYSFMIECMVAVCNMNLNSLLQTYVISKEMIDDTLLGDLPLSVSLKKMKIVAFDRFQN